MYKEDLIDMVRNSDKLLREVPISKYNMIWDRVENMTEEDAKILMESVLSERLGYGGKIAKNSLMIMANKIKNPIKKAKALERIKKWEEERHALMKSRDRKIVGGAIIGAAGLKAYRYLKDKKSKKTEPKK